MARKKQTKKGMHPAFAVVLLLGAAGYAGKSLWSDPAAPTPSPGEVVVVDPEMTEDDSSGPGGAVAWRDLLRTHGSLPEQSAVRNAFSVILVDASAPAPAGETLPVPVGEWIGDDPPTLHLGVILVSGDARRCVLGGRVVGVGDELAGGHVVAIDRGLVRLRWHDYELTYDLDGDSPREFRPELARRQQAAGEGMPDEADEASGVEDPTATNQKEKN